MELDSAATDSKRGQRSTSFHALHSGGMEKVFPLSCNRQRPVHYGMTDGTADDIEPPRATRENPTPDQFVYVHDFYSRIVLPTFTAPQPGEELVKLLAYQKKTSHDDRTVVCLYRQ